MTELSGTLAGVGLPAIVRFLSGLHKTGSLHISHGEWRGEVFFDAGRIVSASLGSKDGLPAIEALVQSVPDGAFRFDAAARQPASPNVHMDQAALQAQLDDLAARAASGSACLPSLDAVPHVVQNDAPDSVDEPMPLDRATLQTLLALDGQHTVSEIVAQRGSLDTLWQIATLTESGLVKLEARARQPGTASVPVPSPTAATIVAPMAAAHAAATAMSAPTSVLAPPTPIANASHCPKLGFEDDPSSSFGRPTRLHRCYAAASPLPLSLDQQRELCFSSQFGSCPRLAGAGINAATPKPWTRAPIEAEPRSTEKDPRIVHLPIGGRSNGTPEVARRSAEEPTPLRFVSNGTSSHTAPAAPGTPGTQANPTPLRARMTRPTPRPASAAVAEPAADQPASRVPARPARQRSETQADFDSAPAVGLLRRMPMAVLAAAAIGIVAIAAVGALLITNLAGSLPTGLLSGDDTSVDAATLPNTRAVEAGTPVAQLSAPRATPVTAAAATAAPVVATPVPSPAAQDRTGTLIDEAFADNSRNWPSNQQGTAWLTGGLYRIAPRQAGQFVAIGVPGTAALQDVIASATFHKVGGPPGGGYGIIVRDQSGGTLDGSNQTGRYYVVEVGDRGEVGIWMRDSDHWVDMLPWQRSDAVRPNTAVNEMTVQAIGDQLTLSVNGAQVATRTDGTLRGGGVGLFVGGDGNQVAVDHVSVQIP